MKLGVPRLNDADCFKADSVFSGISTFGRLPYFPCLASDEEKYDIAFIGEFSLAVPHAVLTSNLRCTIRHRQYVDHCFSTIHVLKHGFELQRPTGRVLDSVPLASDKVPAASTSSMYLLDKSLPLPLPKAHVKCGSAGDTMFR